MFNLIYPKAEELNKFNQILVQIIRFSLQASYILQKNSNLNMKFLNLTAKIRNKEKIQKKLYYSFLATGVVYPTENFPFEHEILKLNCKKIRKKEN